MARNIGTQANISRIRFNEQAAAPAAPAAGYAIIYVDTNNRLFSRDNGGIATYTPIEDFISVSAGVADVGKAIVLDAGGQIDASMINDADIDHALLSNVTADQHHNAFIGLEDNAGAIITPDADDRIQFTDDGLVNVDDGGGGNTLAFSIDSATLSPTIDHNLTNNLAVGDVHTQYLLLTGRSGGQIVYGGIDASDDLTLSSTSHATKGNIYFGVAGSRFDNRGIPEFRGNSGVGNNFIGNLAGNVAATGTSNIGIGSFALDAVTSGGANVGIGTNALGSMQTGSNNVALGSGSLGLSVSGSNCFGLGNAALSKATGSNNVAIGASALTNLTSATDCIAIGTSAGAFNETGSQNVTIGGSAGIGVSGNSYQRNVFIGWSAGLNITTGSSNIFIGRVAGYRQTNNSNRLILDSQLRASAAAEETDSIIYGTMAAAPASQTLRLNASVIISEDLSVTGIRVEGGSLSHMIYTDPALATENIALLAAAAPNWQTMDRGLFIGDTSNAPTGNPAAGGFLYVNAGALTYRGSGGTITVVAAA